MPYYLIYIFAFFFGNFGSPEGVSDNMLAFKYLCFLYSWYVLATSIFIFISFQIPSLKDYLYNLLGKDYVISCIGNPGVRPLVKAGGVAIGFAVGNEVGKDMDARQKERAAKAVVDNFKDLHSTTGQPMNPNSKEFTKAAETFRKILETPAKGPFDRNEERVGTGHVIESAKETLLRGIGWKK